MRSKLFRKSVAGISAIAMLGTVGFVPITASADESEREYTVLYTQDYESATAADWTTANSDRYIPELKSDATNKWQGVDMSTRNNNGTTLSSPSYASYVADKTEYAIEFDAAIGFTDGNQKGTTFSVNTGDGYLLQLTSADGITWAINGSASQHLTFVTSGYTTGTTSTSTWYHYIIIYKDGDTHLKVLDTDGNTVFEPAIIVSGTNTGKLSNFTFATSRYYANFEIDNVLIRTIDQYDKFGQRGVEELNDIAFTSELNRTITQPAEDAPVHLPITVKANGIYGSNLTDAEGIDIKWTVTGLDNEDGYISLTKEEGTDLGTVGENPDGSATAYFNVRNGVSNWFGSVTATVTYLDKTLDITTPFAVIGASSSGTNLAPAAGYPENMSDYDDALVGFVGTSNAINSQDLVLNNWSMYGSNGTRSLSLQKDEDGTKYLRFAINGGSGSAVPLYQLAEQTSQYIVDMKVRFTGGAMAFGHYNNTPNNKENAPNWTCSYGSGALTIGTQSINGINATDWYRIVVSADESAGTYWAKVYDNDGALVGETSDEPLLATASNTQKYFCFQGTYPLDLASFRIYYPTAASMTINTDAETIQVPEAETPATADLSAVLKDTDGYNMSGAVTWSLGDDYAGIDLTANGAQGATLSVTNEAGAGTITVVAAYGSTRAEKEIALSTTGNAIAFTSSVSSFTIPFEGGEAVTGTFAAEPRNKDGDKLDAAVTYEMVDASGEKVTNARGITFNEETGVLTVEAGAASKIVYIKATSVVGEGDEAETLTSRVKVNIHGLSFAFGSDEPSDDSYTQVTASDAYTDKLGYGFADTSAVTNEASDVKGTAAYTFKAKVPNGNYVITVETTADSITSEVVDTVTAITGISKSGSTFSVAVCDEVLDLTFPVNSTVTTLSISQAAAKSPLTKPMVYAIGDSTTNNTASGACSWGNCVSNGYVAIPDCFSGFSNNGMAGRDSVNFYNQGRVETVLLSVCPGDYVTVNMGINSKETGEAAAYYTLMKYYYVEGILQRGGIPVIVTATPDGPVGTALEGDYDAATGKFTNNRGDGARNNVLRQIAAEENLNLIELGQWGEDWMNTLTLDDVAAYNAEYGTEFTTVLEMVQSWYLDHNHYTAYLGTKIGEYLLGEVAKIASGEVPTPPTPTETAPTPTETAPAPTETAPTPTETAPTPTETAPTPTETAPAPSGEKCTKIVAEYNNDGTLKNVTITEAPVEEATAAVTDGNKKTMYWDSIDGMKSVVTIEAPEQATETAPEEPASTETAPEEPAPTETAPEEPTATVEPCDPLTPLAVTALPKDTLITFDAGVGTTYVEPAVFGDYVAVYAGTYLDSARSIAIDESNKTITNKYTSRIKLGGTGTLDANGAPALRTISVTPAEAGVLAVDFAHASSSGDNRSLIAYQSGANIGEESVEANATATLKVNVAANEPVYLYSGSSGINIYGIVLTDESADSGDEGGEAPAQGELTAQTTAAEWTFAQADYRAFGTSTISDSGAETVSLTSPVVLNNIQVIAGSSTKVDIDSSGKTFGETKYTSRLKLSGEGSSTKRAVSFIPGADGTVNVYALSASSSEVRTLTVEQDGETKGTFEAGSTETIPEAVAVTAGSPVYIYGSGGINIYAVIYTPAG